MQCFQVRKFSLMDAAAIYFKSPIRRYHPRPLVLLHLRKE